MNSADDFFQSDAFFDAGDVVQFDMEVQSSMRRAHNPRLVVEQAGAGLPEALRQSASSAVRAQTTAKVIPFEPRSARLPQEPLRVSEA
ncbi:hypothetical protein [Roseobacter sinensis]|uniref:Uncharacterized protein n=1 Tax=Roseobacter sinensis TaxID=2931391 RepID=A0ABT3BBW9_9RHOB|nr:hypothetical protein [Roseobacter sp. WL0113]MCV3271040.1 hypothetical protein [Roseobacter sp. WL0113]